MEINEKKEIKNIETPRFENDEEDFVPTLWDNSKLKPLEIKMRKEYIAKLKKWLNTFLQN